MTVEEYFSDPRLARLYDTLCGGRDDIEFYLALAEGIGATTIIDIGCGTGLLAIELAGRGHQVTGVDPRAACSRWPAPARSRSGELDGW